MRNTGNNEAALQAFIARKAEIDAMLARLAQLSDDHFGADPEAINWADVGTIESYAATLKQLGFVVHEVTGAGRTAMQVTRLGRATRLPSRRRRRRR